MLAQACASSAPPNVPPGTPIVIIAGDTNCNGEVDGVVAKATRRDAKQLRAALTEGIVIAEPPLSPEPELVQDIISHSGSARGLTIFYSGHGESGRGNQKVAQLCLGTNREKRVSVMQLMAIAGKESSAHPLWTFALINSCYSAHVNLSENHAAASVLTVAHEDVNVFRKYSEGTGGTIIGDALVAILRNRGGKHRLDGNCDGLITDQELFDELVAELASDESVQGVESPPHLNLRREGVTHIPLAIRPMREVGCDPEAKRRDVEETLGRLNGGSAALVRELIGGQIALGKGAGFRSLTSDIALPQSKIDFYTLGSEDPLMLSGLRELVGRTALQEFPGTASQAQLIARYSISFDVYLLQSRLGGTWVRVVRLRDNRVMHTGPIADGLIPLQRLASRISIVPSEYDIGRTIVQFRGDVPKTATNLPGLLFNPRRAESIACKEEVGQCFAVSRD